MNFTAIINQFFGTLSIVAQVATVLIFIFLIIKKQQIFVKFFSEKKSLFCIFVVAFLAILGSLIYSEVIGYEPCKLCWFQRIFMYPQVFILGLALLKKDFHMFDYSILLSAFGAFIAGYHYLLQIGIAPSLPCSAVGYSVACSQRFVMQYGYITLPLMAFSTFILMLVLGIGAKISAKSKTN